MVGGCSTIDIDGDGDSDIVLTRGREWEKPRAGRSSVAVFRNEGGRFRDVTGELGIHTGHYAGGIASGDVDGDGDEDLFVAGLRGHALLLNDTPFVDHTREAGLEVKDSWTTSAVFLDVENDGDLDLFVTAYIQWSELLEASQGFELSFDFPNCCGSCVPSDEPALCQSATPQSSRRFAC
ncbi:MAG: FG-GAP-like repeat-containing protein [Myxococcota bacterium]